MSEAYIRQVDYLFEVDGECWSASWSEDGEYVWIEENRKNGPEDTHMCAGAIKPPDGYYYAWEDTPSQIIDCAGQSTADAILAYLNKHPKPED